MNVVVIEGDRIVAAGAVAAGHVRRTVENPNFAFGTTSAAEHLAHLGLRDHVSNELPVIVTYGKQPTVTRSGSAKK